MKTKYTFLAVSMLFFMNTALQSQTLTANAGQDLGICMGASAALGGSPTASGGTTPYHYLWSPSASLNNDTLANPWAQPLSTTTYTVTVTDALLNTATDNVVITVYPPVVANAGNDQSICAGSCAYLNSSGGISYQWSPAGSLSNVNISNPVACPLTTTNYTVMITDANGCSATDNILVNVVPDPVVSVTANPLSICSGGCTTISATGGTTYMWSTGAIGASFTTCPTVTTTYYLTVSTSNGCTGSGNVTVNVGNLSVGLSASDASCGLCNGSITATVLGGNPPYSYTWTGGSNLPILTGVCPGNYFVTVTDMTGCQGIDSVDVNNVNYLSVVLDSLQNANCSNNAAGNISVHADCGAGMYAYSWSNGSTTPSINNLGAGVYTVTVSDQNATSATASFVVSNTANIYASITVINTNCGNNGSATVHAFGNYPPFTYYWSDAQHQTTATAVNLGPGTYYVTVTDSLGCTYIATTYTLPLGCYNIIRGRIYLDSNQNCVQDIGEAGIPNKVLYVNPGPYYGTTDSLGDFIIMTPNMNNTLSAPYNMNAPFVITCPLTGTYTINFSQQGDTSLANNFGYYADPNYFDLGIHPGWTGASPGFTKTYWVLYYNNGPTAQNALIRFEYDSLLQFTGCTQGGVNYPTQHKIEWTLNNLQPGTYWNWSTKPEVYFDVPTTLPINTLLHSCFEILPISGDANPADNILCADEVVTGSHDPNSKAVSPVGVGAEGYISPNDSVLLYTIHFQNDGNDTAFTVVVVDTLSPYLNPATVVPGASNHTYTFDVSGQGIVTFRFDNILLPDSNVNEPESNGYLNFTVKQKHNNPDGTVIYNTAYNYFDFNEPVGTNTVKNTISTTLSIINELSDSKNIHVYPNPFTDMFNIEIPGVATYPCSITIFNDLTEKVLTTSINKPLSTINCSGLTSGFYFFRVVDKNGSTIGKGTLVVK